MKDKLINKDYIKLYLENFFSNFANSIYAVFTPVILYKSGVSISMILIIYAIQFLVMGVFTPISEIITNKFGIAFTKGINYILKTISLLLVLTISIDDIFIQLLIPVIYGFSGAITNPLNTYIPSIIVENKVRGKFNSFRYILRTFSSILGYIFVTIFLIKDNNFVIIITVTLSYVFATISLINLKNNRFKHNIKNSFVECYKYLFKNNENRELKLVGGFRSFMIIESLIAIPLYIYISFGNLKTFTTIYVLSTIIELLSLFISGIKMDKNSKKTFGIITYIKSCTSFIFLLFKNKYVLIANQSIYKLISNVYDSSYSVVQQRKVKNDKKDTFTLSMVHEMNLCLYEFLELIVLSIISMYSGIVVFKIIFFFTIITLISINILVKKWN